MLKLTGERVNGIKSGYWSAKNRETIVQKLGAVEHQSGKLLEQVCDKCCRHPFELEQDELDSVCAGCPVTQLAELIGIE